MLFNTASETFFDTARKQNGQVKGVIFRVPQGLLTPFQRLFDVVWCSWMIHGIPVASGEPFVSVAACRNNCHPRVTFHGEMEAAFILDQDMRHFLYRAPFMLGLKNNDAQGSIAYTGGQVCFLANPFCVEPCCMELRARLRSRERSRLLQTRITCLICPDILMTAAWTGMSAWDVSIQALSPERQAWMCAVARSPRRH
jgi:hypothetical protein